MDGIALKSLTVSFHEYGFVSKLNSENQFGPWFTLSNREKQQLGSPMGPNNPQALNRYSYTLNNPVRYTDPSGHVTIRTERARVTNAERIHLMAYLNTAQKNQRDSDNIAMVVALAFLGAVGGVAGTAAAGAGGIASIVQSRAVEDANEDLNTVLEAAQRFMNLSGSTTSYLEITYFFDYDGTLQAEITAYNPVVGGSISYRVTNSKAATSLYQATQNIP
jgi:hypothetical protein